jgi:hypothetical protein
MSIKTEFRHARTCYGHLAGEVAVEVLQAMLDDRWLTAAGRDYTLTRRGEAKLAALGIDVPKLRRGRRLFARTCLDLTERRPHLAGALGDALVDLYVERGWIRRRRGSRVVSIAPNGYTAFQQYFVTS